MAPAKTSERPVVSLDSDKTAATVSAYIDLERAQARVRWAEDAALAGEVNGSTLATARDDLNLAQLRADRAQAAADAERDALGSDTEILDALNDLIQDPELNTTGMLEAFAGLANALTKVQTVTKNRNDAMTRWIMRLRDLGVPDRGLTVGGDEVSIVTGAGTQHHIRYGGATVSSITNVAAQIAHVTAPFLGSNTRRTDPSDLTGLDRRGSTATPAATVRLLRAIGGRQRGEELSTRKHNPMNLARFVRDGVAELISGELPEPPEAKLRVVLGGAPGPLSAERADLAGDQHVVDAAVRNAFGAA